MHEDTKKKSIDRAPVRIRPPDGGQRDREDIGHADGWAGDLSVPTRTDPLPRWLSVEQVRKMQRMRRETVQAAIKTGELPFERRGRITYVRLTDVLAWEEKRLKPDAAKKAVFIHPELKGLL